MVLSEYAAAHPGFRFRILATDISTAVLEKAEAGIYSSECVAPVPPALKRKYLMRGRDPNSRVRVVPELRSLVEFRRLNFMDADYGLPKKSTPSSAATFSSTSIAPRRKASCVSWCNISHPRATCSSVTPRHCTNGSARRAGGSRTVPESSMPDLN